MDWDTARCEQREVRLQRDPFLAGRSSDGSDSPTTPMFSKSQPRSTTPAAKCGSYAAADVAHGQNSHSPSQPHSGLRGRQKAGCPLVRFQKNSDIAGATAKVGRTSGRYAVRRAVTFDPKRKSNCGKCAAANPTLNVGAHPTAKPSGAVNGWAGRRVQPSAFGPYRTLVVAVIAQQQLVHRAPRSASSASASTRQVLTSSPEPAGVSVAAWHRVRQ